MEPLSLLTLLKIAHLTGLVMGLGGAVLADYTIFRHGVIRPVNRYAIHQAEFLSRIVTAGLVVLWLTGLALIWVIAIDRPEFLTNQKLWAKLVIVIVLTINGTFIHKYVLPFLLKSEGRCLFDGEPTRKVLAMTFFGSVSVTSWSIPFVLGKAVELSYVTPVETILFLYSACLLTVWGGIFTTIMGIQYAQKSNLVSLIRWTADTSPDLSGEPAVPVQLQQTRRESLSGLI